MFVVVSLCGIVASWVGLQLIVMLFVVCELGDAAEVHDRQRSGACCMAWVRCRVIINALLRSIRVCNIDLEVCGSSQSLL